MRIIKLRKGLPPIMALYVNQLSIKAGGPNHTSNAWLVGLGLTVFQSTSNRLQEKARKKMNI